VLVKPQVEAREAAWYGRRGWRGWKVAGSVMRELGALVVSGLLLSGAASCYLSHEPPSGGPREVTAPDPPGGAVGGPLPAGEPTMRPDRRPSDRDPTTTPEPPFTLIDPPIAIEAEPGYMFVPNHQILGDLDGDGVDDFVLFAVDPATIDIFAEHVESAAYVFYGRGDLPPQIDATDADAILRGRGFAFAMPYPLTGAVGDVNGDGLADLVIPGSGSLHFVFGSQRRLSGEHAIADVALSWTFTGFPNPPVAPLAQPVLFGLVPAGDLHGDGISDFALALQTGTREEQYDTGVIHSPVLSTFLFAGRRGAWPSGAFDPAWASAELVGPDGSSGCTLSTAADLDGDGRSDLLLLVQGGLRLLRGGEVALRGKVLASEAGVALSAGVQVHRLPDIDGDGSDELTWKDFSLLPNTYVTYGGDGLLSRLALEPDLDVAADNQAVGTMTAADLDGDGVEDLIVATSRLLSEPDPASVPAGGIYVVPGGSAPRSGQLVLPDRHLLLGGNDGVSQGPLIGPFGNSLDAGGDVTGDGIADLLATVAVMDGSPFGRSRVLLIPGGLKRSER
jgi:hypothetical protein